MKDYRLSEMKKICEYNSNCHICPFIDFCKNIQEGLSLMDAIIALKIDSAENEEKR